MGVWLKSPCKSTLEQWKMSVWQEYKFCKTQFKNSKEEVNCKVKFAYYDTQFMFKIVIKATTLQQGEIFMKIVYETEEQHIPFVAPLA